MFSSLFASCKTTASPTNAALKRCVAEDPAAQLGPNLRHLLTASAPSEALFTARLDSASGATIWHLAAEREDPDALRHLHSTYISQPATPSSVASGRSARRIAASTRGGAVPPFCIPDKQGRTPLLISCQGGKVQAVQDLLAWGADPMTERDKRGRTPLHLAALSGTSGGRGAAIVKMLLQVARGERPEPSTMSPAPAAAAVAAPPTPQLAQERQPVQQQGQEAPQQGQELGGQQAQQAQQAQQGSQQAQQGSQQAQQGSQQAQQGSHQGQLVSPRSSPQGPQVQQLQEGHEPQLPQLQHRQRRVTETNEQCRAMVACTDSNGLTPLHYAVAANDVAACQLLMDAGASVTATSTQASYDNALPCNAGMTPLHVAAMNNSFKAAHLLLTAWSRLSVQERVRLYPLGPRAAGADAGGTSGLSLDPRAIVDKEGKTACMVAASRRFEALADLLDPSQPPVGHGCGVDGDGATGEAREAPPSTLCCPITMDLMEDPVVISDGFSYERAAIEKWLLSNTTSPLTNLPLAHKIIFPNRVLRQAIMDWRAAHGLPELPAEPRACAPHSPARGGARSQNPTQPVLQGGMGDGFIRAMADGGAANGRFR